MSTAQILMEEGIQEGMQVKTIETARKMLEEGFDLLMISKITGLTEEEIRVLEK